MPICLQLHICRNTSSTRPLVWEHHNQHVHGKHQGEPIPPGSIRATGRQGGRHLVQTVLRGPGGGHLGRKRGGRAPRGHRLQLRPARLLEADVAAPVAGLRTRAREVGATRKRADAQQRCSARTLGGEEAAGPRRACEGQRTWLEIKAGMPGCRGMPLYVREYAVQKLRRAPARAGARSTSPARQAARSACPAARPHASPRPRGRAERRRHRRRRPALRAAQSGCLRRRGRRCGLHTDPRLL